MGLRAKVALWLLAAIVPTTIIVAVWRVSSEHRELLERRADRFASRIENRGMNRCERDPRRFQIRRRDFVAYAYAPDLASANRDAPPIPRKLAGAPLQVGEPVHQWFFPGRKFLGATLIRRADAGPCAVVFVGWKAGAAPTITLRRAFLQTGALTTLLALLGVLVTFPIVRRIRRLEEAVRQARSGPFELDLAGDDEINHLATAFQETLDAVRQREEALEEYIANTTHDLAIPLTVLQHRLHKLAGHDDGNEDVRIALEESHYIAALIANMRSAAKLENPTSLSTEHDVELGNVVQRVIQRHAPIAAQKKVELDFAIGDDPIVVRAEPTLIEQALSNLVQNAVQYNSAGGHVSVILEARPDDRFEIRVADDGPGIPPDVLPDVLRRGVRSDDARTRNAGGQGFGLAIVRRICDLHGWDLALENDGGLIVLLQGDAKAGSVD